MNSKGRVLIIEDNKDWQDVLKGYLEEAALYVEIADNLQDALTMITEKNYHFATIDMQLNPETLHPSQYEGWEIMEQIVRHRIDRRMPTMIITAYEKDYERFKKIRKLKGTYFMSKKSFDKEKFIGAVTWSIERLGIYFSS